jgi:alpha-galactosidase
MALGLALGTGIGIAGPAAAVAPATTRSAAQHPLGDLAPTPPMGWNSWNSFHCDVSAALVEQTADAMVSSGMRDAGYEYVNIDDCWSVKDHRDDDGRLIPDPVKFPDGIKGVADYVHSKGLKLGIYSSAGDLTCAGYPASLGREQIDAQTWADWGVDLLKYDNCGDHQGLTEQQRYQQMSDALAATGRPIVLSLCDWGNGQDWLWNGTAQVGHYWRNTGDISARWSSVLNNLDQQTEMWRYAGPNNWADPDMLEVGVSPLTYTESRAHMALWAVLNAPLISGNDLRSMSSQTRKLLTNPTVIAVDQDWSGQIGKRLTHTEDQDVWYKKMSDGSAAVVLLNRSDQPQTISIRDTQIGQKTSGLVVKNVWTGASNSSNSIVRARVAPHDAAFFLVSNGNNKALESLASVQTIAPDYVANTKAFTATVRLYNDGRSVLKKPRISLSVPDGWVATTPTSAQLSNVASGGTAELKVRLNPDSPDVGATNTLTSQVSWTVNGAVRSTTDSTSFAVVTPPPAGTTQVSALPFLSATNYWGPVERDQSNGESASGDGKTLTIGGQEFATGLGAHAPSTIEIYAGQACDAFDAQVGIDDEVGDRGDVTFRVLADGVQKASVHATGGDAAQSITADVAGANVVSLVIDEGSDTLYDHSDWADATLSC